MTERFLSIRRTRETKDALEWARVRNTPPARALQPPALPAESYGIQLHDCPPSKRGDRTRLTLDACAARWKIANATPRNTSSARTGGYESDMRASQCNGCAVGAVRLGKTCKPRKPLVDHTRTCSDTPSGKGCGAPFSPLQPHHKRCPRCVEAEKARQGDGQPRSRSWGNRPVRVRP